MGCCGGHNSHKTKMSRDPLELLAKRYLDGEITKEEYEKFKKLLSTDNTKSHDDNDGKEQRGF